MTGPLVLYSGKFVKSKTTKPKSVLSGLSKRSWLVYTQSYNGNVERDYLPLVHSMHRLMQPHHTGLLSEYNKAVLKSDEKSIHTKFQQLCDAANGYEYRHTQSNQKQSDKKSYNPATDSHIPYFSTFLSSLTGKISKKPSISSSIDAKPSQNPIRSSIKCPNTWREVAASTNSYGPPQLLSTIAFQSLHEHYLPVVYSQPECGFSVFVLCAMVERLGSSKNPDKIKAAYDLINKGKWSDSAKNLAISTLWRSVSWNMRSVYDMLLNVSVAKSFKLLPSMQNQLLNTKDATLRADIIVELAKQGVSMKSKLLEKTLRLTYGSSEVNSLKIMSIVALCRLPSGFYPFIVKQLCRRLSLPEASVELTDASEDTAAPSFVDSDDNNLVKNIDTTNETTNQVENRKEYQILNELFNSSMIADLAEHHADITLHCLSIYILATKGIQDLQAVLSRWQTLDPKGVNSQTWLRIFQHFRRLGEPTKCDAILATVLSNPSTAKLDLAFMNEYLLSVAQFYNVHIYMNTLLRVLPELAHSMESLGITEYVSRVPQPDEYVPSARMLSAVNRDFEIDHRLHESWLTITYQSVLATVESQAELETLFTKYLDVAKNAKRTTLYVTDQFVAKMLALNIGAPTVDHAESIFLTALEKLSAILSVRADGRNHCRSVQVLVAAWVRRGELYRAIDLIRKAHSSRAIILTSAAVAPLQNALREKDREDFDAWCKDIGIL